MKFATDITERKLPSANPAGQIAAISRSQGVIQFALDGTILNANPNVLAVVGYSLAALVAESQQRMQVLARTLDVLSSGEKAA